MRKLVLNVDLNSPHLADELKSPAAAAAVAAVAARALQAQAPHLAQLLRPDLALARLVRKGQLGRAGLLDRGHGSIRKRIRQSG